MGEGEGWKRAWGPPAGRPIVGIAGAGGAAAFWCAARCLWPTHIMGSPSSMLGMLVGAQERRSPIGRGGLSGVPLREGGRDVLAGESGR